MKVKLKRLPGMDLNINTTEVYTDIPEWITSKKITHATQNDNHLNALMTYMIHGWPLAGAERKMK